MICLLMCFKSFCVSYIWNEFCVGMINDDVCFNEVHVECNNVVLVCLIVYTCLCVIRRTNFTENSILKCPTKFFHFDWYFPNIFTRFCTDVFL